MQDPVNLDVIGMAVAAVIVIPDDDVGVLTVENRGELESGVRRVDAVEGARVVILLPPGHP